MVVQTSASAFAANGEADVSRKDASWTDFDSTSFQTDIMKRRKKKSNLDSSQMGKEIRSDQSATESWMKAPINSDASWIPMAPPSMMSNAHQKLKIHDIAKGDDAPRDGPALNTPQSPAVRRRAARLQQSRLDETSRTDTTLAGALPINHSKGRAQISDSEKHLPHDSNGTPIRRGRTSVRVPGESRPRSTSRPNSGFRAQVPITRERSKTPSKEAKSGNFAFAATHRGEHILSPKGARQATLVLPNPTGSSNSVGPGLARPTNNRYAFGSLHDDRSAGTAGSARTLDANIGRHVNFGTTAPNPYQKKEGGLLKKLFGNSGDTESKKMFRMESSITTGSDSSFRLPDRIHTRKLLSATIYHNAASNLWIVTVNTNQRGVNANPATASKFLKAFSFSTEKEARESAIANAPPKMLPFSENPNCFICNSKFAVFRRPSHCRNCGVCVCNTCVTSWSSRMIPEMYNLKNEGNVTICSTCEWLSDAFKNALTKGDYHTIVALYGTGNINLRTPFPAGKRDKKGETMHPIHCAVEGGNLKVLRWLLEERFCPVKRIASGNGKQKRGEDIPILTSRGRSVLNIAMNNLQIEIIRYLVVDRNVSVHEMKDLALCLRVLESALISIPHRHVPLRTRDIVARWAGDGYEGEDASDISGSIQDVATHNDDSTRAGSRLTSDLSDTCIICYANPIDCVITPCGHQICCLACGENMRSCPVCNVECGFIQTFKP